MPGTDVYEWDLLRGYECLANPNPNIDGNFECYDGRVVSNIDECCTCVSADDCPLITDYKVCLGELCAMSARVGGSNDRCSRDQDGKYIEFSCETNSDGKVRSVGTLVDDSSCTASTQDPTETRQVQSTATGVCYKNPDGSDYVGDPRTCCRAATDGGSEAYECVHKLADCDYGCENGQCLQELCRDSDDVSGTLEDTTSPLSLIEQTEIFGVTSIITPDTYQRAQMTLDSEDYCVTCSDRAVLRDADANGVLINTEGCVEDTVGGNHYIAEQHCDEESLPEKQLSTIMRCPEDENGFMICKFDTGGAKCVTNPMVAMPYNDFNQMGDPGTGGPAPFYEECDDSVQGEITTLKPISWGTTFFRVGGSISNRECTSDSYCSLFTMCGATSIAQLTSCLDDPASLNYRCGTAGLCEWARDPKYQTTYDTCDGASVVDYGCVANGDGWNKVGTPTACGYRQTCSGGVCVSTGGFTATVADMGQTYVIDPVINVVDWSSQRLFG